MPKLFQDELLAQHLNTYLGGLDEAAMDLLRRHLSGWRSLAARP